MENAAVAPDSSLSIVEVEGTKMNVVLGESLALFAGIVTLDVMKGGSP